MKVGRGERGGVARGERAVRESGEGGGEKGEVRERKISRRGIRREKEGREIGREGMRGKYRNSRW